jgi:hypothetical protein
MKQTRSKLARRQKVTVQWLPAELIIEIFRRVQKLIGRVDFNQAPWDSLKLDQEYYDNLLAFALSAKEWTAIAQAELFRHIILKDRSKMGRFLEALRGNEKLRELSRGVTSLNLGSSSRIFEVEGLGDDLDEIALYCPNVVEVSTLQVDVRLEYFRMSLQSHLAQRNVLTSLFARRKYEEVGQAQHDRWICPAAFDFWRTKPALQPPHHAAISLRYHHRISP